MTQLTPAQERFRAMAIEESGMPISAGVRVGHILQSVESGRAYYVDMSAVPDEKRPTLVNEIKELVRRASDPAAVAAV